MESTSRAYSAPKVERRIVEKNRRNHMKSLYSKLYSLLPNHTSKAAGALPDQIDEAVNYIKSLQLKVERSKERKEILSSSKKRHRLSPTGELITPTLKSPKIQISEMGSALDIALVSGQEDTFVFTEIIRIIHEEGAEVVNANSSLVGNSVFHVVHAKMGEFMPTLIAARVSNRLKEFIHGSISDLESQPQPWEFEIHPDVWEFEIPQVLLPAVGV